MALENLKIKKRKKKKNEEWNRLCESVSLLSERITFNIWRMFCSVSVWDILVIFCYK